METKPKPISLLLREQKHSFRSLSNGIFNEYKIKATAQHLNNIARGRNDATPELETYIRLYLNPELTIPIRNHQDDIHELCLMAEIIQQKFGKSTANKLMLKTILYKAVDIAENAFSIMISSKDTEVLHHFDIQHMQTKISHYANYLLTSANNELEVLEVLNNIVTTNIIPKKMLVTSVYESNIANVSFIEDIVMCAARKIIVHPREEEQINLNKRDLLDTWYLDANKNNGDSICNIIEKSYKKFDIRLTPLFKNTEIKNIWQHVNEIDIFEYTSDSMKDKRHLLRNLDQIKSDLQQNGLI